MTTEPRPPKQPKTKKGTFDKQRAAESGKKGGTAPHVNGRRKKKRRS